MEIEKIPLKVSVLLGAATLPVDAYHQLEVGDILILDQRIATPLPLKVGEEVKYCGYPGLLEMRKAIQVEKAHE